MMIPPPQVDYPRTLLHPTPYRKRVRLKCHREISHLVASRDPVEHGFGNPFDAGFRLCRLNRGEIGAVRDRLNDPDIPASDL
jgi:hypothetical protein